MPSTTRVKELWRQYIGREITPEEFANIGGTEGGGVNLSDEEFIRGIVLPSSQFRENVDKIVTESYRFGLGRPVDASGQATYRDFVTRLFLAGKNANQIFEETVRNLFSSEEASLRGQVAIEREYLEKYERPILLEIAKAEIAPEFKERLEDQLRRFQLRKDRAKEDLDILTKGFVAEDALTTFDPEVPVGQLEVSRRRLWEDYQNNIAQLAEREQIDSQKLLNAQGLRGMAFGGVAEREKTELGREFGVAREEVGRTRVRGVEDVIRKAEEAGRLKERTFEEVGIEEELTRREEARTERGTAERLAEQRLLEPRLQRRERLRNILQVPEEEFAKQFEGISPFQV